MFKLFYSLVFTSLVFLNSLNAKISKDLLPLDYIVILPSNAVATLSDAVDELYKELILSRSQLEDGDSTNIEDFFVEYIFALQSLNQVGKQNLYNSLLTQVYYKVVIYINEEASQNYYNTYLFIKELLKVYQVPPSPDQNVLDDEVLLHSISNIATKGQISNYNLDYYIKQLHDKSLSKILILEILNIYQAIYLGNPNQHRIAKKFSGVLKKLLREYHLNNSEQYQLLNLIYYADLPSMLAWYRKANLSFSNTEHTEVSVLCFTIHKAFNSYEDSQQAIDSNVVKHKIKNIISLGGDLNTDCIGMTSKEYLIKRAHQSIFPEEILKQILNNRL